MVSDEPILQEPAIDAAMALERELLDPAVRSDRREVERLLAPDFTEIGRLGRLWTRDEIVHSIGGFASAWGPMAISSEMEGRMLADDLVLLNYVTESPSGYARRSSVWRHSIEKWQIVFHQGTTLPDANRSDRSHTSSISAP